jgi:RND family efflux transporter MFP subunit
MNSLLLTRAHRTGKTLVWPGITAAALVLSACSKPQPAPEVVRSVKTMTIAAAALNAPEEFAGEVRARSESRLGFRVGGKIVKRHVESGQAVRAGQALMELDASDYQLAQQAAAAGLSAAQVNRDQAQADLRRFNELYSQGFISSAELDRRKTAFEAAQAQYNQARAQASVQGNQARYSTLVADADGIVTGIEAEPGQVVQAGTPVLRLARNGPRDVVFAMPEDQVARIKPGDTVKVRLWANEAQSLPATVREVAAAADALTRTYTVKAALANDASAMLKLGMSATVELNGAAAGVPAIKLPLTAVFESKQQPHVWVWDPQSSTVSAQSVKVAGAQGNDAVVVAGLKPGQVVVTAGTHVLQPGQKVKPLNGKAASEVAPATAPVPAAKQS